jgi:hypothetical protein
MKEEYAGRCREIRKWDGKGKGKKEKGRRGE